MPRGSPPLLRNRMRGSRGNGTTWGRLLLVFNRYIYRNIAQGPAICLKIERYRAGVGAAARGGGTALWLGLHLRGEAVVDVHRHVDPAQVRRRAAAWKKRKLRDRAFHGDRGNLRHGRRVELDDERE